MSAAEEERRAPSAEWLSKRGGLGKWLVLTLARRHTGMTLQELGDQMGGMDYSAVSVGLKRFETRLKCDRRGLCLSEASG